MNYIYCITNTINNKRYVGKTTQSIQTRFNQHCCDSQREYKGKIPLYIAMNKYGIENFIIEELEQVEDETQLNERECYWIQELETYGIHGYNATKGGDGALLYDYNEIIDLYNLGYSPSEISHKISCDVRTVSNVLRSKGVKSRGSSRIIELYDLNDNPLQTFNGSREAANWLIKQGLTSSKKISNAQCLIAKCCRGVSKTSFGYKWKYIKPI